MRFLLVLCLSLFSLLQAARPSSPDEIANLCAEPSAIVGGYLNVITGDFVYRKSDLTVTGAIPLVCDRFFSSREKKKRSEKWEIHNHHRATYDGYELCIQEDSGVWIPYKKIAKGLYLPRESFFKTGASFHSTHDPRLNRVEFIGRKLTVYQSDGSVRNFGVYWRYTRHSNKQKITKFVLDSEILPSGHRKVYNWKIKPHQWSSSETLFANERVPYLKGIRITSPDGMTTLSEVSYRYKHNRIKGVGSNGKKIEYETRSDSDSKLGYIEHVNSSDHPRESLKWKGRRLKKFILPNKSKIHLHYHKSKINKMELPEGLVYELEYYKGFTNVTFPDSSKATYYHKNHHLDKIVRYDYRRTLLKTETFAWTDDGKLAQKGVLDPEGELVLLVEYAYDELGNLIEKKTKGTICGSGLDTLSIEYAYDGLHRLVEERTNTGKSTLYEYLKTTHLPTQIVERQDEVITKRTRYEYNADHLVSSEIVDDGDFSPVSYRTDFMRLQSGPYAGMPCWIDRFCNGHLLCKTQCTYNKYGDVEKEETFGSDGSFSHSVHSKFDEKGLLLSHKDGRGNIYSYEYDANRNLIKEERPSGLTLKRVYDKLGRLRQEDAIAKKETQTTTYGYNKGFEPTSVKDHLGNLLLNEYNGLGHLIRTTLPNNGVIKHTYDVLGHLTSKTDPRGFTTHIQANVLGEPLKIEHPDGTTQSYTYNLEGKVATHIDQNGARTTYQYDLYGNLCEEIFTSCDGSSWTKKSNYNAFGLLSECDTEGFMTHFYYDDRNQLSSKTRAGVEIRYTHDPLGRMRTETREDATSLRQYDVAGNVLVEEEYADGELLTKTETSYNSSNLPTQIIRYPNNKKAKTRIAYDPFDRPIEKIDACGNRCTFLYEGNTTKTFYPGGITTHEIHNSLGKVEIYRKYDPKGLLVEEKRYEFDKAGNTLSEWSGDYRVEFAYDSMGRKQSQIECKKRVTSYTYTPIGEIDTLQKPDGTTLTYTYDGLGHLASLTSSKGDIDYRYTHNSFGQLLTSRDNRTGKATLRKLDPEGKLLEETQASGRTLTYTYSPSGNRESLTLPNKEIIEYTFKGRYIQSITSQGKTHTFVHDLAGNTIGETTILGTKIKRTYDPLNRPTMIESNHLLQASQYDARGNLESTLQEGSVKSYAYDAQDRLIEEPEHTYSYDLLHNRISHNRATYSHNAFNEIEGYVYDENGNLLNDGKLKYKYDSLDRLIEVGASTFTYDAQHRRMDLIWDHDQEMGTLEYFRILDPTHPAEYAIAILNDNEMLLPIHDMQNNLVKIFTLEKAPIEIRDLTAFGEVTGQVEIPWTFCAKRITEEDLLYFGRRYYSPKEGRFINPDPAGYTDSLNLYTYAMNNPLIYYDPTGLASDIISMPNIVFPMTDPSECPQFSNYDQFCGDRIPSHIEAWQFYKPQREISRPHDLGLPELPDRIVIQINGIMNSFEEAQSHLGYLSKMYDGYNVHGIYNATHGFHRDGRQVRLSLLRKYTNPEKELYHKLSSYFAEAGPNATALLIPHSHGCIITRNVVEMFKKEEFKNRIFVLAVAPGAFVNPLTCGYARHLVHPNDFVPRIDWFNRFLYRDTIQFVGKFSSIFRSYHSFQDPVYEDYLQKHLKQYREHGTVTK